MVYVTSDLHGYNLEKFCSFLEKSGFTDNDFLFILGDVIDRHEDGVKILQWLINMPNAQLILGNHEAMMLSCRFIFDEITDESIERLDEDKLQLLSHWMMNGAEPTVKALRKLKSENPEAIKDILDYLADAPLFEAVEAGGKDFLLTHSGLENFNENRRISEYSDHELLWNRPDINDKYFSDMITVFGHTPTQLLDINSKGKMLKTDTWIDIDTGAAGSFNPMLLRLDDLKEFYM